MVVAAVFVRLGKRFGICGKVVEAIVVLSLTWLVMLVFGVKRLGVGRCGEFLKDVVVNMVSIVSSW